MNNFNTLIDRKEAYIQTEIGDFFENNDYTLNQKELETLTFENEYSFLKLRYEAHRYGKGMLFTHIKLVSKQTNKQYLIDDIIEYLNPNLNLKQLVKDYANGKLASKEMTNDIAYLNIIDKYLRSVIKNGDFSWESKVEPTILY